MTGKRDDTMGGIAVLLLYLGGVCLAWTLGGWQAGSAVAAWLGAGGVALVLAEERRR
jgi:nucleoside recognition membrane protein YjiH